MALAGVAKADDIVAFTRAGCGPCERFKADFAKDPAMANPHKLHVMDSKSELGESYGVRVVPTFIRLKNGKESGRKVGYGGKGEFRDWLGR